MPTSRPQLTPSDLVQAIDRMPMVLRDDCVSGDCDAFALALLDLLGEQAVPAALFVGERREYDEDGELIEENVLSHVVVDALGTDWDVLGPDASARWDGQWDDQRDQGETHAFTWLPIAPEALRALRQNKDQRPVNDACQTTCFHALQAACLAHLMAPVERPSRPLPRVP